jgi:hypothetical protein
VARLGKKFPKPDGAQDEEYYLAMATNELAKQGWEAVAFDSRRVLMRRSAIKQGVYCGTQLDDASIREFE